MWAVTAEQTEEEIKDVVFITRWFLDSAVQKHQNKEDTGTKMIKSSWRGCHSCINSTFRIFWRFKNNTKAQISQATRAISHTFLCSEAETKDNLASLLAP